MKLISAFLALALPLWAAPLSQAEFEAKVESVRQDTGAPSIVMATQWVGHAPRFAAKGVADFSTKLSATAQTSYLWFSVTKLFTSLQAMRLVEQGKLKLDTPVSEILPEFNYANPYGVTITVAHLLSHTSGIPKPGMSANFSSIHLVKEPAPDPMEVLARWSPTGKKLASEPGEQFEYNNAGFLWLGQVIAKAGGRPFSTQIEDEILKPLGMTHTGFKHADMAQAARGYGKSFSLLGFIGHVTANTKFHAPAPLGLNGISHYYVDVPAPSGLVGPVEDVVKFATMVLNGGMGPQGRLIKAETLNSMFIPHQNKKGEILTAGLGFWIEDVDGERTAYHQGTGGGFRTEMRIYPKSGYATVVATNLLSFDTHPLAKLKVEP